MPAAPAGLADPAQAAAADVTEPEVALLADAACTGWRARVSSLHGGLHAAELLARRYAGALQVPCC